MEIVLNQHLVLLLLCVTAIMICFLSVIIPSNIHSAANGDIPFRDSLTFGVNVYGWIRGDFGGGRTARSVINNLHSVNMSLTAVEIRGADLHSTTNVAIEDQGLDLFPRKNFAFDLFVINAANTPSILCDPDNDIDPDHYRIGLWHWETSRLPLVQGSYGKYYNEIWVPTQFVADAILSTKSFPSSDVKVVVLPYGYESLPPVSSSPTGGDKQVHRKELPLILQRIIWKSREPVLMSSHAAETLRYWADTTITTITTTDITTNTGTGDYLGGSISNSNTITLFLVVFDFNSDYNRKNIIATVRAFLKAFPSDNGGRVQGSSAGLIIKSINAHDQIDDYNRLQWVMQGGQQEGITYDQRIVLFNGHCSEVNMQQLKLATDCYVSLHRAEGLGLNLLEAALIGLPVVASAYSGSEQFMAPLYGLLAPELRIPTFTVKVLLSLLLTYSLTNLLTYLLLCMYVCMLHMFNDLW
jgi:glycosyltransferase involved in cell wall biosynthesis